MDTTTKKTLKYAILPGFIPRIFALFTSGFSTLAYYIAIVYNIVKLLPDTHPYLQKQNIGKYGIRHVIIAAADNLVFKRQNIDQIIIFFTIMGGLIIVAIQFVLLIFAFIASQSAFALTFPIPDLFNNPNTTTGSLGPEQDLAFIILDRVFGLVGVYNSCIAMSVACESNAGVPSPAAIPGAYPYPFHTALHLMLKFYSLGIACVGMLMFIYFIITIVAETAATGTPFGQRFNRAWAPIRFMLFFALIVPINNANNTGLNGAQILTFWVAKHGSNFATNGWAYFNKQLTTGTYLGPQANIIGEPNAPEMGSLNQFILTARTCAIAEGQKYNNDIYPYLIRPEPPNYITPPPPPGSVNPNASLLIGTPYAQAIQFSYQGNIKIRFGHVGNGTTPAENEDYGGFVKPWCGEMTIETTDVFEPGSIYIAEEYYELIKTLWNDTSTITAAQCIVNSTLNGPNVDPNCPNQPDSTYVDTLQTNYDTYVQAAIANGVNQQRTNGNFLVPATLIEKGWAGAAIWFNRVAEMNGAVMTAAKNIPHQDRYPLIMEKTLEERLKQNANTTGRNRYNPELSNGVSLYIEEGREEIYPALYRAFTFWEDTNANDTIETQSTGNAVIDVINLILGTSGIFEMRKNTDTHPLAQLTNIGKGMIDATIRNTAIAGAGFVGGGVGSILGQFPANISKAISGFMFSVVFASLGIGAILYYVLPFLPFIYFLFAVSGWIKSIFEAVVAMPLWALAHIRIDGEGIPGQDAANGYFLLLEIFLRPILILFGLLASISIFSALVYVLNNVFDLMVTNVGGSDAQLENQIAAGSVTLPSSINFYRGPIDEFFFTAMYAVICYLMGISCFKLVDLIPNNILRWIGANAATFQENAGDPAGQLTNNVYRGSVLVTNQIDNATQGNLAAMIT